MRKEIYLAGGCFWGVEGYFKNIKGVVDTQVGYANGNRDNTFYEIVRITKHAETVKVVYDTDITNLETILEYFYYIIDPFSINRQGNDIGLQYRSGIYSKDSKDLDKAKEFIDNKQKKEERKIEIEVKELKNFVLAEDYHQDYLDKNPGGYCHINLNDIPEFDN
ncbi:MAG: peptide-methionine (S)-S-oxide reductase MsrA [Tissierellia bacterium]|nr:peptide-methionine (S)-S-oxide reductase MsrA [Tissierellia bacterium]